MNLLKTKNCFFILLVFFAQACSKDKENVSGEAILNINLLGVDVEDTSIPRSAFSPSLHMASSEENDNYTTYVKVNDSLILGAELKLEEKDKKRVTKKGSGISKLAATEQLGDQVRYKLLVYKDGVLDQEVSYQVGETKPSLQLLPQVPYTFICFSMGTDEPLPTINNKESLATATISGISGTVDLMYYAANNVILNPGTNNLNIVLKHKYSQVTTIINSSVGNIGTITNARLTTLRGNNTLKISNGALTYGSTITAGSPVIFGAGTTSKTSSPTIIASSGATGALNIGSLTLGGVTNSNITIGNLPLVPGQRYTLTISPKDPYELTPGKIWAPGNLLYSYSASTGHSWYFATPTHHGHYFPFGKIYPVFTDQGTPSAERTTGLVHYNSNTNGDPCKFVTPVNGKQWRTPSFEEYDQLASKGFVPTTQSGVAGGLFNNTVFFPAASYWAWRNDLNKFIRYSNGHGFYWTTESRTQVGMSYGHAYFSHGSGYNYFSIAYWDTALAGLTNYQRSGLTIRCVRDK